MNAHKQKMYLLGLALSSFFANSMFGMQPDSALKKFNADLKQLQTKTTVQSSLEELVQRAQQLTNELNTQLTTGNQKFSWPTYENYKQTMNELNKLIAKTAEQKALSVKILSLRFKQMTLDGAAAKQKAFEQAQAKQQKIEETSPQEIQTLQQIIQDMVHPNIQMNDEMYKSFEQTIVANSEKLPKNHPIVQQAKQVLEQERAKFLDNEKIVLKQLDELLKDLKKITDTLQIEDIIIKRTSDLEASEDIFRSFDDSATNFYKFLDTKNHIEYEKNFEEQLQKLKNILYFNEFIKELNLSQKTEQEKQAEILKFFTKKLAEWENRKKSSAYGYITALLKKAYENIAQKFENDLINDQELKALEKYTSFSIQELEGQEQEHLEMIKDHEERIKNKNEKWLQEDLDEAKRLLKEVQFALAIKKS
ncbi:MAG: hypothetical protein UU47_C0014G0003 [candidate division TM6 bacterium GW2011_GWE2_41_16]|nr:MAG: hypothetical protein UU47_C0014G0003 [candidate division TM6 bacterium GW2011_GWE2_41_16]